MVGQKGFGPLAVNSRGPGYIWGCHRLFSSPSRNWYAHAPEDAPAEDLLKITERIEKLAVELRF